MTLNLLKSLSHNKRQKSLFTSCMNKINNCVFTLCSRIVTKIMHLRFNFDACPMHSPFGFVHLMHQNLSKRALFCHNSLAKVNTHVKLESPEILEIICFLLILLIRVMQRCYYLSLAIPFYLLLLPLG